MPKNARSCEHKKRENKRVKVKSQAELEALKKTFNYVSNDLKQIVHFKSITNDYEIGTFLGEGISSKVYKA